MGASALTDALRLIDVNFVGVNPWTLGKLSVLVRNEDFEMLWSKAIEDLRVNDFGPDVGDE